MKQYKIDCRIWCSRRFREIPDEEKIEVIYRITQGTEDRFKDFIGPMFRVADEGKRRPDLYSARWRHLRARVIEQQGTTCHYCGEDCAGSPTIDHVIPVSEGHDPYDESNLVVACRPCNSRKGPRTAETIN